MDNLVSETNSRLTDIIANLTKIKEEYEEKLKANSVEIDAQLEKVQKYKTEFFESKAKIEKMNADIEGFETDYQKLVERFKDDELANILIAANKEISLKIDERKRKIVKDKNAMNELVDKAENVKSKLVKLTSEKKALELCLNKILDAYNYYSTVLGDIINYSSTHKDNLTGNMPAIEQTTTSIDIDTDITASNDENDEVKEDFDNVEEDFDIDEDITEDEDNHEVEKVNEISNDIMDDVEDEVTESLEPVDISDMVKDEEVSDYDNEEVIEGNEHKIVIENDNVESFVQDEKESEKKKDKKDKKKKDKDKDEDINIDINFDDSLEDDDSLYE